MTHFDGSHTHSLSGGVNPAVQHAHAGLCAHTNAMPHPGQNTDNRHELSHPDTPKQKAPREVVIRRTFAFEVKADSINEQDRSLRMIASTNTIDSYGDIVEQYWDLSRYIKNPAVLWNHNMHRWSSSNSAELIPVGSSRKTEVTGGRLEFEPVIGTSDANPIAENVWQGLAQGLLRAASVGFRPGKVSRIVDDEGRTVAYKFGSPEKPNHLVEISIVPLPANQDAVALGMGMPGPAEYEEQQALERRALEALADRDDHSTLTAASAAERETMAHETNKDPVQPDPKASPESADVSAAERQRIAELEETVKSQSAELEQFRAEQRKLQAKAEEHDVDALVGTKIVPAAKAAFLELRRLNEKLFGEIVRELPELRLAGEVVKDEAPSQQVKATGDGDARLAAAVREKK